MASLPPQQPQRRSSNRQQSSDVPPHQIQRSESDAPSSTSIDSQTVILNAPSAETAADKTETETQDAASTKPSRPPPVEDSPDRCWICFGEPSEDKTPAVWRHPCKCALPAHESCLLDWIADLESPGSNRSATRRAEIHCPNCQSVIQLARPRSHAVELYGILEQLETKALLPATIAGLSYMVFLAFSHHGAHSIRTVFGDHDASIILRPRTYNNWNWFERQTAYYFPNSARPFWREWRGLRVELGLPLIPLALIASRTRLGDAALPFLPVAFFATNTLTSETLHLGYWPPSAALSLVLLPYIRSAYNECMERAWGERERGWAKEVKPSFEGRDDSEADAGEGAADDAPNDADVIEIRVGLDVEEDSESEDDEMEHEVEEAVNQADGNQQGDQAQVGEPAGQVEPALENRNANQVDIEELLLREQERQDGREGEQGVQNQQNNQNQNRQQNRQRRDFERHFDLLKSAHAVAETVFGALLFPTVSSISGEILRLILPISWVTTPGPRRATTGLLQTKWGRSIVGGCLFVVLKDAFRIYCRWRAAVSFRERRVRDFDKSRGVYV